MNSSSAIIYISFSNLLISFSNKVQISFNLSLFIFTQDISISLIVSISGISIS
ncbi:MAG: hypothetical protein P1U46_03045 [Patescibacteria group bacterium]|nr:hypothetical protein [Patescibacteria group bacterium]